MKECFCSRINRRSKKEGKKKDKDSDFDPPPKRLKQYVLTQLENENGFKISNNPYLEEVPQTITIELAYDIPDGKPFKKYSPLDFNIKQMEILQTNVDVDTLEKNRIEFSPTSKEFELKVTGFDVNRDLIINVN